MERRRQPAEALAHTELVAALGTRALVESRLENFAECTKACISDTENGALMHWLHCPVDSGVAPGTFTPSHL